MPKQRIVLVDDNGILLEAMKRVLDGEDDLDVVATASTCREGLLIIKKQTPDVAVIDYRFAGENDGLKLARDIKQVRPEVKIIMLTAWPLTDDEAKAAGCDALLDKAAMLNNLAWVLRSLKDD